MDTTAKLAVIYTDGGCQQKIGIGGWGIHGYTYENEKPKRGSGCPNGIPTSLGYQAKKTATADEVTVTEYIDGCGSIISDVTNNVAELKAFLKAMEIAAQQEFEHVLFILDSEYVLQGVQEWLSSWKERDWKRSDGQDPANLELWKRVDNMVQALQEKNIKMSFDWVKGHSGNVGNQMADHGANKGQVVAAKGLNHTDVVVSPAQGYWNTKATYSRMFGASRLVFFSNVGETEKNDLGYYTYHLFDPPSQWDFEFFGARESSACYCVLYLNEPEPTIESVKRMQSELMRDKLSSVVAMRLDSVFKPRIYSELTHTESLYLYTQKPKNDLYMVGKYPITNELRPPRLAFRGVENLQHIGSVLDKYLRDPQSCGCVVTDITDVLYEDNSTKKKTNVKLRNEFGVSTKTLDTGVRIHCRGEQEDIVTRLIFGIDLPKRNVLAALADPQTRVKILTWPQSEKVFHIATVMETKDGVGIWANVSTNYRFVATGQN